MNWTNKFKGLRCGIYKSMCKLSITEHTDKWTQPILSIYANINRSRLSISPLSTTSITITDQTFSLFTTQHQLQNQITIALIRPRPNSIRRPHINRVVKSKIPSEGPFIAHVCQQWAANPTCAAGRQRRSEKFHNSVKVLKFLEVV